MDNTGGAPAVRCRTMPDQDIPQELNGGSGFHVRNVRILTEGIGRQLLKLSDRHGLSDREVEKIALASSLHDVGKTRIPHRILEKQGALTSEEYAIVKRHTVLGGDLIAEASGFPDGALQKYAEEIARYHHERYDGSGYPEGLKGDAIPIGAQIVSIADAYEALTARRSYKKALAREAALDMIGKGSCGAFDPVLVQCLIQYCGFL